MSYANSAVDVIVSVPDSTEQQPELSKVISRTKPATRGCAVASAKAAMNGAAAGPRAHHKEVSPELREQVNLRWLAVLEKDPANELALTQLASNKITAKLFVQADEYIHRLQQLSNVTKNDRFYSLMARHAAQEGRYDMAISYWLQAIEKGYDSLSGNLNIAGQLIHTKNISQARLHIERAMGDSDPSERARMLLARCSMIEFDWKNAIDILQDLETFSEQRSSAAKMLFHCYMNDHRNESATRLCQLLEQDNAAGAYHLHGQLMFRKNMYGEALEKFTRAIDMDGSIESKIWLIKTLTSIHEDAEAVTQIQLLEKTADATPLVKGRCWEAAGVLSRAEQYYMEAVKSEPSVATFQALVRFLYTYRKWNTAYLMYLRARKHGFVSQIIEDIASDISKAYRCRKRRLPTLGLPLFRRDFHSTEEMVTGIVDRILVNRTVPDQACVENPRRVVLVIGSLGPGGAERQVVNLANGLVEKASEIHVDLLCTHLSRKEQDRFYEPQVDSRVSVSEYYDKRKRLVPSDIPQLSDYADLLAGIQPESRLQTILHMARSLVEIQPDVVHGWLDETFINTSLVCGMLGIDNSVGRWGSMPAGVNRTVNERDLDNIHYLNHAYRQIARIGGIKYSSNSRLTADAYADLLGISKESVDIVYNGVDQKSLELHASQSLDIRSQLAIPDGAPVMGTIFRISEEKRPELWVQVAKLLSESIPDMHFIMVGAGPLESVVGKMVQDEGIGNFHMVGKKEDVGAWYEVFDVLLLTSRVEGVSNVVVESQLCGCPVVAPNVGGLSEAILDGETGYLLSDHSPEALSEPVRKILLDKEFRKTMSDAARRYASGKFSIEKMVDQYSRLFGRAAGNS